MEESLDLDWLISVDDHVLEPPHVWQDRVATKFEGSGAAAHPT